MLGSKPLIRVGAMAVLGGALLVLLAQSGTLPNLLETDGFEPHGHCFLWIPSLTRIFVISDTLIGMSYLVISGFLTYIVYKASRNIPFNWVFLAFGAFIFTCGLTHFMDVYTLWTPTYWLHGYVKAITAVASVATALLLPPLVPRVLALAEAARTSEQRRRQLVQSNADLQAEVTERRRVEAELREALQREQHLNEFRARFVSRMSHEFRTPLAIAMTASDLLKSYADRMTDEQKTERLDKIQTEIRSMGRLLDDILMMNKIEAGSLRFTPATTSIADLARLAVERAQETTERHRITLTTSGDCPQTQLDTRLVGQLLDVLLSNAVKYSPDAENVAVDLQCDPREIVVTVRDEGMGIPPQDMPQVFTPFFRGSNVFNIPGTGLGLAIAHHVATLHGGTLSLDSTLSHGTTVTLRLPVPPPTT